MIKYTVRCAKDHDFEGWFKDSATFEAQSKKGQVICPVCGSKKVVRAPMAPSIPKKGRDASAKLADVARQLRAEVEKNCDYVGDKFAEEARKIHYGETEARGIYGEATLDDAKELDEEGIPVVPLPVPREDA